MRSFNLLVAAFALLQCFRYARRALLFVLPTVRVWGEPGAAPRSARRLRLGESLEKLGFASLGIQHELSPLGARSVEGDVYASAQRGVYADVVEYRPGDGPAVVFFTPFASGAAVMTASFHRRAIATEDVQAGGISDAPLDAVLAAHQVAVVRFARRHGPPTVTAEFEARLEATRAWFRGEGRRELRRTNATAFVIVLFGLVLFASAVNSLVRGAI
jgi:hypothetical protein